ncbi:hypothetical protein PIB30_092582, partial [Stylosanthes scabra]|nr:hypothetical protein [Stylosanthes scabra]
MGLGAPRNAGIYWDRGEPLGGKKALLPLIKEFPNFYNKEDLPKPGELEPFANKASLMATIDYIVSEIVTFVQIQQKASQFDLNKKADFQQWVRNFPFSEKVSWTIGRMVLTTGLVFI